MLESRHKFEVDGQRFRADTGGVETDPGGSAHTFVKIADKPGRRLIQIVPSLNAVALFSGLGQAVHDFETDQDALSAPGRGWHVEFLGLPLDGSECSTASPLE